MALFKDIELSPDLLKAIEKMGFEEMTPIQEKGIPLVMEGRDMIGQAQTGTGKTACFGIPVIESIESACETIEAVVITPTRELAIQVAEELNRIGQFKHISSLPVYGGQDINMQIRALKKRPQIIVATPGRLMDHMERHTIKMGNVRTVILDEADEMLDMGFIEDIEKILQKIPEERQTLLFSATMPRRIQELAEKFMHDPIKVLTKPKELTVPDIEQTYLEVKEKEKFDVLCRLLDTQAPLLAIVFGRTKRRVDELSEGLEKRGYLAEGIHGDLTQARRETVLRRFKDSMIEILVATDVAARGLDISGVTHVYNFDIPQDAESYVHRIGRTGRAGNSGMAVTFVAEREMGQLNVIRDLLKVKIKRISVPTPGEAVAGQQAIARSNLLQTVAEENYENYRALAEELLTLTDPVTLLAAAMKMITKEPDLTPVKLTAERPIVVKQKKQNDHQRNRSERNRNNTGKNKTHRSMKQKFDKDNGNAYHKAQNNARKHENNKAAKFDFSDEAADMSSAELNEDAFKRFYSKGKNGYRSKKDYRREVISDRHNSDDEYADHKGIKGNRGRNHRAQGDKNGY